MVIIHCDGENGVAAGQACVIYAHYPVRLAGVPGYQKPLQDHERHARPPPRAGRMVGSTPTSPRDERGQGREADGTTRPRWPVRVAGDQEAAPATRSPAAAQPRAAMVQDTAACRTSAAGANTAAGSPMSAMPALLAYSSAATVESSGGRRYAGIRDRVEERVSAATVIGATSARRGQPRHQGYGRRSDGQARGNSAELTARTR